MDEPNRGDLVTHKLSSGQEIQLPPHDEFYRQFTTRNTGVISDADQQRLRTATILVAGCGSVGGAAVEPLIRFGAEHLVLVEPDEYDLHNLNRQNMRLQDIGRNKAEGLRERVSDINPYAEVSLETSGITADNVERLVQSADIIIDGVDVTTQSPLLMKFLLHKQARRYRKPVISGYDVAGLQLLHIYDYRKPSVQVLHGKVKESEIQTIQPFQFLRRVVPIAALPYEIVGELRRQIRGEREGFPQIVYTANLFGVMTLPAVLEILAGRPIKQRIICDVPTLLRPARERARVLVARLRGLYHLNNEFRRSTRQDRSSSAGQNQATAEQ
ncbi:hypothetical protein BH23CHL2_BH23CHL2_06550 [soil metagenome]